MANLEGRTRSYLVRHARDEDGPQLQKLIADIFSEYEGVIFVLDELADLRSPKSSFDAHRGEFFVVEYDQKIVASVAYEIDADNLRAELCRLYVHKMHRREGIAQLLLEKVERIVRAKHVQEMHLWSDRLFLDAHRFYLRNQYLQLQETRALNDVSDTIEFHFSKQL